MKRISFFLVSMFVCLFASAQITWNVKAGAGLATMKGDVEDLEGKLGWKIGVGIEKPLSANWLIMPSLEFKQKGTQASFSDEYEDVDSKISLTYLQLPILAAWRTRLDSDWNMTLKGGPYLAYALTGKLKERYSDKTESYNDEWDIFDEDSSYKRFDAGLLLGVDLEYHRFVVGAEFEYGLLPFYNDKEWDEKVYNMSLYVTLGYKF